MNKFFFIVFVTFFSTAKSQNSLEAIKAFQQKLNKEFADRKTSPLTDSDFAVFKGLDFYKPDLKYRVIATFELNPFPVPFEMPTTTSRKPMYQKYGTLFFEIEGQKCQLTVYQNIDLMQKEEYKNHLFVPFSDLTNGKQTYGGGRYLDLTLPLLSETVIDFNQAYNPYCAYNKKYSCPLIPKENRLTVAIKAGVKKQ